MQIMHHGVNYAPWNCNGYVRVVGRGILKKCSPLAVVKYASLRPRNGTLSHGDLEK